jgi:hypothetical protein
MIKYKNHRIKSLWDNITVIDTTYCGEEDILKLPVYKPPVREDIENIINNDEYGLEKIIIPKGTSICQLEILPCMEEMEFNDMVLEEYKEYNKVVRGGFGSTDK